MANRWTNIDEWIKSDPNLKKMLQGGHIQERWDLMKGTKTSAQNAAWANATKDIKNEMSAIHQIGNIISSLNGMGFGYDITKKGNGNYSINFYPGNDRTFKGKIPSIEFGVAGQGTTGKMGVIIKNNIPSMNALSGMINSKGNFQLVTALERGLYDISKRLGQKGDIRHLTGAKFTNEQKANYLQWLLSNTIAEANSASPNMATSRQKYENNKAMSVNERSLEGIGQVSGVVSMKGFQQDLLREYRKVFQNNEKNVVRALDDIAKLRMGIADDKKFANAVARKFPEIANSAAWGKIDTFMNGLRALGIRQGSVSENASGQVGLFGVAQPFTQFEQIHSKKSKQNSAWLQTQPHKHGQQRHAAYRGQIFTTAEQAKMGIKGQDPLRDIYKIADVSEKNITTAYNNLFNKYVKQKGWSENKFRQKFGNNIGGINLGGLLLSASTLGDFDAIQKRSATTTRKALDYQTSLGLSNKEALRKLFGIKRGERFTYSEDKETGLLTADISRVLKSPIFKAMTPSGALRGVAQHVQDDELLAEILLAAGYSEKQIFANGKDLSEGLKIQGVQQRTDSYKAKHLYELVTDQMNYVASEYINDIIGKKTGPEADAARDKGKQKFTKDFMDYMLKNKFLSTKTNGDFLTWNGSDIIVSGKDVKNKARFLQGIGAFAASRGYYKENPFSYGKDEKDGRFFKISQNLIRGRQIARTSNSVEAGAHGVKWGYREMEGVKRRLGMMRWAGQGAEADVLQQYYDELFKNTELSQEDYNKMKAEETKILQNSRNAKLDKSNVKGRVVTLSELENLGLDFHADRDELSGQLKNIDKTAAGFIAKLQENGLDVYLDPGMIYGGKNAKGEMWNGRLIQLPNIGFTSEINDAGETVYKASSAERVGALNALLRGVDNTLAEEGISDTDKMIRIGDAAEEMFEALREDLYSKDLDNNSYQKAHRIRMETAGMEMSVASNFNPENGPYADKTTNAIILNSKDFRKRLGRNIDKLSAQYEDLYGSEPKLGDNLTEQEQIVLLQNAIIKASTIGSAEFAATEEKGIVGSGNRWPSSGGRDARSFRMLVAANDKDIAEHTMYIDPALQMIMHGDNDSDKIAEFNDFASDLAAKGYSKEQMKKLLAARRAEAQFEALETQYMRQINAGKIDNGEDTGYSKLKLSELNNLNDIEKQEVELFYTKYGKKFTGIFSSIFQGFTQAMLGGNLDEATILSGDDMASKKNAVAAMLVRSLFRAPTENAISAKKAAEMLTLNGGQGWYNKLDDLHKLMTNPSTYSSQEGMSYLLQQMQEAGILDDDDENILKSGGDNYLNQIIGQLLTTPDGAEILAEFAGATDVKAFEQGLKSGNIHITKDMLLSGLMHINSSMAGVSGKGVSVNGTTVHGLSDVAENIYKFIPGYGRNLEYYNNPVYTDLAEEKVQQIQSLADALDVAEDASRREAEAEKAKIGIANSESVAIQRLAKEYNNLQNNVNKSAEAYEDFEKKRYVSPHSLLDVASPYVDKGKIDTTGFLSRLNRTDLGPYLGYSEEDFIKYRDKSISSIIGTYSTGISDLLAKNSGYGVSTLNDLFREAEKDNNIELVNEIVKLKGDFEKTIKTLFPDKTAEEQKNYVDLITSVGGGFYHNIAKRIINAETDSFDTEVGLGRFDLQTKYNEAGQKYRSLMIDKGFADAIISKVEEIPDRSSGYNEETHSYNSTINAHIIEILDNKLSTLDAPIANWALQIMDYAQMLRDAATYIKKNKISSKEEFSNSAYGQALAKEGRLDFILNNFGALSDPNLQFRATNAIANVNPKSKHFGTVRNFSLDQAVMEGKDARANAIFQKYNKGEVITEEEKAYLEGRYSENTTYSTERFASLPAVRETPISKTKTGITKEKATLAEYKAYANQYAKSAKEIAQLEGRMGKMSPEQRDMYNDYLADLYTQRNEAQSKLKPLYDSLDEKDVKLAEEYNAQLDNTIKKVYAQQGANGQAQKKSLFGQLADGIKTSMQRMFSFGMIGYKIVGKISQAFQKVIGYAQQLDQAMVNIQIVTGKTRDEAFDLMDSYNKLAKQLGSTTTEVANSANVWLRQGYSVNKVNELITSSLYLSKLGMLDTATAAKDLTGIIKGFKLEVSEATNVVSKLTMIDQNAAVSAGNIATAMQQVSASAQQAGLDINTTMGYISTIADVSQRDPSSVGASLRTIISRYGTVKAGAFSGMGVDNTGDDLENINDIEKVLRRLGISIRTSTMEFRALDEVLGEIADKWMEYSSVERNAIATAFAGTRQRESFLILMSNMDKARELTQVAAESQGMAELKYQAYLESAEAATKRLQNAWEGLTNTFKTSNFLAGIKNFLAGFVENLDKIAVTLGNIFLTAKAMHGVGVFQKMGAKGAFGQFFGNKKDFFIKATNYVNGNEWTSYLPTYSNYLKDLVRMVGVISEQKPQSIPASPKAKGAAAGTAAGSEGAVAPTNTVPFYVTSGGKKAYRGADGKWYYVNKGDKLGSREVGGKWIADLDSKEAAAAKQEADEAERLRQEKIAHRGGTFGQRLARGAAAGTAAGIMQGITTGKFLKDRDGEDASSQAKVAAGVTTGLATGVATGLLSAIPVAGPLLGSTFGPVIGQILNNTLAPWMASIIDQQAVARRERSKEAEKAYSAIKAIQNDTNTLKELSSEGALSFDQYQKAKTAVDNMVTQLYGNTKAGRILLSQYNPSLDMDSLSDIEVIDRIKLLFNNYLIGDENTRQEVIKNWERALYQAEADTFRASKENEFYENREILQTNYVKHAYGGGVKSIIDDFIKANPEGFEENARRDGKLFFAGSASDRLNTGRRLLEYLEDQGKESSDFYKKLQKYIAELNNAVHNIDNSVVDINEKQVKASATRAGIGDLTTAQIKNLGIDEIARRILIDINEQGGFFEEKGNTQRKYQWTGSLDTLAKIPRDYINSYIKNNATLYGVLTGQSYTLGEVSRGALTGQKAEEYMVSFAKQLNISLEELNANLERYSSFSLGDIMKGYGDVKSALENLDSLFSSIVSSTGLTADNFEDILSKYPDLIGQVGDIGSLVAEIFNKTDVYIEEQRKNLIEDLGSNEGFFNSWKLTLSKEMLDLMKGTALENANSGASFWDAYMTLTEGDKEKFSEIAESFKKQFNSVTADVSIDTTILDKYRSYLSKIYEMQIKNLQEQKSALEKVNTQREYENKLVQARIKLENAQNEKVQVYREGIGFVYEADQEAIQQAQEELDKLENEKVIDSLDMIITEMQSQKDWLDQFSDREEFRNLEKAFGDNSPFAEALGTENSGIWGSVNTLIQMYAATHKFSSEGFTSARTSVWTKNKEELASSLSQNSTDYDAYIRIRNGFSQYFKGEIDDAGLYKLLIAESVNNENSESVRTYATNMIGNLEKNNYSSSAVLGGVHNTQEQIQTTLEEASTAAARMQNTFHVTDETTQRFTGRNILALKAQNTNVEGIKEYKARLARKAVDDLLTQAISQGDTLTKWKNFAEKIIEFFKEHEEFNVDIALLESKLKAIKKDFERYADYDPTFRKDFFVPYLFRTSDIITDDNLSGSVADSYAAGSLFARGGLSSISELGPELYATPGLSGTALIPEGSKVIPAEATKGLWELGNFANEFIKPLRSLGGLGSSSSTVFGADESTNINTLNITLRADKDFDADKFIQQLKALQAISKNN